MLICLCPTALAITATETPTVLNFVTNPLRPLCDDAPTIPTRTKKSLNPNDKGKVKPPSKAKKAKPFPSVTPLQIPQSKNTPQQKADKLNTLKSTDFNKQRDDFVDRQQSIQPTKPQPPM